MDEGGIALHVSPPNLRHSRGVKDGAFKRSHARFVSEHDKAYIERHGLSDRVSAAWATCMLQKPADPLAFLSNALRPFAERPTVLRLQEELSDARAAGGAEGPVTARFAGTMTVLGDEEAAAVEASFETLLLDPLLQEEFYTALEEASPDVAHRLRCFDAEATDACGTFPGMLRLVCDNLRRPYIIEGFVRDVARRHVAYGIVERDYDVVCGAWLALVRRHLLRLATERDDATKLAWVRLHALVSTAMAAGGEMRELHAKHQTALAMSPDDLRLVRESLGKVRDRAAAAAAVARGVMDLSPAAAAVLEARGVSPTQMGSKLLGGAELLVEMLEGRGLAPALAYLRVLGQQHEAYGVRPAMYPAVGQALLSAASHSLRVDSEEAVGRALRAWRRALDVAAGLLRRPLAAGDALPSAAATLVRSELRQETPVLPRLEEDLADVVSGRATPEQRDAGGAAGEGREGYGGGVCRAVGDVSNVPVAEGDLRRLFDRYDADGSQWIAKDAMVDILMSQEQFGVPLARVKVARQVDELMRHARVGGEQINFFLFSMIMLKLSQR